MSKNFDLSDFLKLTNADGAIILNAKGELIDSENVENGNNFAAMVAVMVTMASEFSSDIKIGGLKQFICKSDNGVFIVDKFDEDFIVGVYSKELAKAGLIMMSMDNLSKKKQA
ncbi:putative regulator of Ras-like GTPase activity (Roadblock/LC7/MglB family) [Tenacibaculum adriaticum]|uniref:Putative regulator of Ras-like GTPase activity (Roadblock/LC7/MglB family) n=1 Tax=Tenacibaculum adriaticum TaxID=413713 RepID=A0A5S5DWJ4_9FLAO|nr:roadblock/LC7 domain-containing protein [Tenacibaculum adriaticum]TYQ00351.1 putative regulator of Ras-like GTPase activity (Roadblock/LC7/MglB family) [Tenacibaculum adriaticum]